MCHQVGVFHKRYVWYSHVQKTGSFSKTVLQPGSALPMEGQISQGLWSAPALCNFCNLGLYCCGATVSQLGRWLSLVSGSNRSAPGDPDWVEQTAAYTLIVPAGSSARTFFEAEVWTSAWLTELLKNMFSIVIAKNKEKLKLIIMNKQEDKKKSEGAAKVKQKTNNQTPHPPISPTMMESAIPSSDHSLVPEAGTAVCEQRRWSMPLLITHLQYSAEFPPPFRPGPT